MDSSTPSTVCVKHHSESDPDIDFDKKAIFSAFFFKMLLFL